MARTFRNGAIGALLDEYEKAILELSGVIKAVPASNLTTIVDPQTADENCRSIQAILTHVVNAGYGYATSIHNSKGHSAVRPAKSYHLRGQEYEQDLADVLTFTVRVFEEISDNEIEQHDNSLKIKTSWEQSYDIEQLMEHAIVHILRHRRQIERIMLEKPGKV